jgi:hypothetical protein
MKRQSVERLLASAFAGKVRSNSYGGEICTHRDCGWDAIVGIAVNSGSCPIREGMTAFSSGAFNAEGYQSTRSIVDGDYTNDKN